MIHNNPTVQTTEKINVTIGQQSKNSTLGELERLLDCSRSKRAHLRHCDRISRQGKSEQRKTETETHTRPWLAYTSTAAGGKRSRSQKWNRKLAQRADLARRKETNNWRESSAPKNTAACGLKSMSWSKVTRKFGYGKHTKWQRAFA
jgi:hypothetical protein